MKVKWLNTIPKSMTGVSWGVPWKKGELSREESLCLMNDKNEKIPLQSWPTAFWPDGSVKWTGHSAVLNGQSQSYEIRIGDNVTSDLAVQVIERNEQIHVDTGILQVAINKIGTNIIEEITSNGKRIANHLKLIAKKEFRKEERERKVIEEIDLESEIEEVKIEKSGIIRNVIKITGHHKFLHDKQQTGLPFKLRLYFYAGTATIKIVHTFFYDGNPQKDYIKGIGIEAAPHIEGENWNRHVCLGGDVGIYPEPAQLLLTRRHQRAKGLYNKQISGEMIDLHDAQYKQIRDHAEQNAEWNDFKLIQDSADHYQIMKRTNKECSWITSTHGTRSKGLLYTGGKNGGLAFGLRNFWQKFPSSIEVSGLTGEQPKMKLWFWSPDANAMDLRHYNTKTHVLSAYEGFDEMRATPYGIANTSEVYLNCYTSPPTHDELTVKMDEWQSPLVLVCEPQYYYDSNALGVWSLPDKTHPVKGKIEEQLDNAILFYKEEMEQRKWYGYWHYGDVMHTYDSVRHQWMYDIGGFAWQNTELVPNIWLWNAFLRSGREDIFIMAEAMTRHTSEVDCYHFGEYAGLGSRHNVIHWGCGCKEARISMAGLHKTYYFLTTDERVGDLLEEVRDADQSILSLDPMREFYPRDEHQTHARVGPDWAAFCSNWFTALERTEEVRYYDKIMSGMNVLKGLPMRLLSGPTFGYDPSTSKLIHMGDGNEGSYHMVIAFGAPQTWFEIADAFEDNEWKDMLVEFGEFYSLSNDEKLKRSNRTLHDKLFPLPMLAAGMVAYAAAAKRDKNLAEKAWDLLLNNEISQMCLPIEKETISVWQNLNEVPGITTNTTSQWCLNTMIALELIGEHVSDLQFKKVLERQECHKK
ncbi:hypothetical protein J2S19_002648 [Metabacillus malikii]|uniref:Uncharacterized protein n=1 Tax=Metabacillus malikii TaxID=1504265 RepID=A0ABT9ZJF6_9BACI|nr:hypothetical protein [Metabacillus malikii]